jgi:hypothetical protein
MRIEEELGIDPTKRLFNRLVQAGTKEAVS